MSALVDDGGVLGERNVHCRATLLQDADGLLASRPGVFRAGYGGGSRSAPGRGALRARAWGSRSARGLALALDVPVAGVSTLDALAAGGRDALSVIDARRGEVFVPGPARGTGRLADLV